MQKSSISTSTTTDPLTSHSNSSINNNNNNNINNSNNNNNNNNQSSINNSPNNNLISKNKKRLQSDINNLHSLQQQKEEKTKNNIQQINSAIVGSNAPIPIVDYDHHCLNNIPKAPRPSYEIHSPKSNKLAPTTFTPISPNSGKQQLGSQQPNHVAGALSKSDIDSSSDEAAGGGYHLTSLSDSNNNNKREEILLPIDILDLIFSQLSFPDRCTCAWVCSTWRCTLMMTPNPLLENCMISLHQPPPEYPKLLPIRHIINSLNITIAPCSCNYCYFHNDPYQFLKKWISYLEPACFSSDLSKVTLRVYHNAPPELPPPTNLITVNNSHSYHHHHHTSPLSPSPTCTSNDPIYSGLTPQLQHECNINHGFSRDYQQQRSHFFDLEKPLALPFHDIGAVIPLSILSSLLNSKIKELKIRVCIDLPYSKRKEEDFFNKIVKVENLSEIGLLTHDPLDPSFSAACKTSQTILDKVFSTLFASPITFINLKRLYLVTTTIDKNVFKNFNSHLPSLEGLHLSVWNHDLGKLFEDITTIFGTKLKELGIRFTTCNGIKYSTSFSHRDRKLEDSMVEQLTSKCPNLTYFSFEGWLSNLSDISFRYFGKLNFKHLVLKNGLDSRICRPIWARLKLDIDNVSYDLITEKELKKFILSQSNLKVFEISASEIDKFTSSSTPITIEPFTANTNTGSLLYRNMISEDFINNVLDKCPKIQYIKIVDNSNYRSYLKGNRSKVSLQHQNPYLQQYLNNFNNNNNDSILNHNNNNNNHVHQSSDLSHFHYNTNNSRELFTIN